MPKQLIGKNCVYCGKPTLKKRRADRKAFYYAKRCPDCQYKAIDPDVIATKRRVLDDIRISAPLGHKSMHRCGSLLYWRVKIAEPNLWEYEHRIVAAKRLGRPLTPKDIVHHIDGNGLNNSPENLQVLSHAEHMAVHGSMIGWSRLHQHCCVCKTTNRKHLARGMCTACYQSERKKGIASRT